jgi:phosphoserine phosphatase
MCPEVNQSSSPESEKSVILITISGRDHPGITSEITEILARHRVNILDIAQAVIQKLLTLSLLFEIDPSSASHETIIKDLLFKTNHLGLRVEFQLLDSNTSPLPFRTVKLNHYAVTLIADCVTAQSLHEVSAALARWKINIDIIKRLSDEQFSCVEMLVSTTEQMEERILRKELLEIAKVQKVDIALQAEGLYRRAKRLVVLDMDSTLIQGEVIDELARENGAYERVAEITHEAMSGRIKFDESLKLRCQHLKGLSLEDLDRVYKKVVLTPGAKDLIEVLKKLGYKIAVISGGFTFVLDRLKEELGIDYAYANTLELKDGLLTGNVIPPIINAQRKADLLDIIAKQQQIALDQVIAIGDGANDLLMLEKAGLGIAFNAKPLVREQADLALSQKNMRSILYLLGLSARDVAEVMED